MERISSEGKKLKQAEKNGLNELERQNTRLRENRMEYDGSLRTQRQSRNRENGVQDIETGGILTGAIGVVSSIASGIGKLLYAS